MESPWKQLHPQDSFRVKIAQPITSYDEQVLSFLYQPIIGMDAFSIYHLFLTLIERNEFDSQEQIHAELFNQLSIDLPRLFNGRVKLEGIGLLKVYAKEKQGRREFIYELQAPLSASELFKDDVLSLLLLDQVGERRYEQLVERFAIPQVNTTSFTEVTKKFVDVFTFKQESLRANQEVLNQAKQAFPEVSAAKLSPQSDSFDWTYFLSLINGLYIDKEQLDNELKETIYTLHQLYGINELEMKQFVEREIDFITNKVTLNQLRLQVLNKYHKDQKQQTQAVAQEITDLSVADQATRRKNTLKLEGFSAGEIEVILAAESISPMIYLTALKKQKGGFVSNPERWAVENLVKKSGLPDSVLNILIHYSLIVQGNTTFYEKSATNIANDWAQGQVFSPEMALLKVKEFAEKAANKRDNAKKQPAKRWQDTNKRRESLPEWVDQKRTETPVSQEEEDYFKEQLRLLRTSTNGKEGES